MKEIEHKYLINSKILKKFIKLKHVPSEKIKQGYISRSPVVRVRIVDNSTAFLTVKGKGSRVRDEFEYEIPIGDAKTLMKLCGTKRLSKIRYTWGKWVIDRFKGRHRGLWLAEIELPSTKAKLPRLPSWIHSEVTYDPNYTNATLASRD